MADALDPLRGRFLDRCQSDLALVRMAMTQPAASSAADFRVAIHRLSGLAGSFGYPELGALAAALDDRLVEGGEPDDAQLSCLEAALEAVTTGRSRD